MDCANEAAAAPYANALNCRPNKTHHMKSEPECAPAFVGGGGNFADNFCCSLMGRNMFCLLLSLVM